MNTQILSDSIRRLLLLFLFLAIIILTLNTQTSFAAVSQQTGFYDTRYINLVNDDCANCHDTYTSDRHHATYLGATSQCAYCHDTLEGQPQINRDCKDCHYASDHHQSTYAANKDCTACHSPQTVSSAVYDPGVYNPPADVPPTQCRNCHTSNQSALPPIYENRDLHHDVGMTCQTCHNTDLSLNIRLCEQCHQPSTLHALHPESCTSCHSNTTPVSLPPVIVQPVLDSLSVTSGLVGESLILTGKDFGSLQGTVKIGVASASVTNWQEQIIEITIPNVAPGNYDVVVVNANGSSNIKVFTVTKPLNSDDPVTYGMPDKPYSQYTESDCRDCHQVTVNLHHSLPDSADCTACHDTVNEKVITERNCLVCHTTSPHHISKEALAGSCTTCHSSDIVSDLNAVPKPDLFIDGQTPTPGSCEICHLGTTQNLHHNTGFSCQTCHESQQNNVVVTIRACENCHSVNTLHKVETHFQAEKCVGCHAQQPDQFPFLPAGPPEMEGLSVNSGGPGSTFIITGSNFGDAFDKGLVYFDQSTAVVQEWSNTSITVQVPNLAKGNYLVTVKNAAGKSNGLIFSVISPGTLSGHITNPAGQALSGAKIVAGTRTVYTDANGNYLINNLAEGAYSVQASLSGYVSAAQSVTLLTSLDVKADFNLAYKVPPDTKPPTAPTGLKTVSVQAAQVALSWYASTDNLGVAGYNVYRNGQLLTQTTNRQYTDTTVAMSTTYQYYVQAYDAAGNKSAISNAISITTPFVDTVPPTAPVLTVRRDSKSYNTAVLSWQAATDNKGIAKYEIYRSTSATGTYSRISSVSASTLTYKNSSLSYGLTYYYYVIAYDAAGNQTKSNVGSIYITGRYTWHDDSNKSPGKPDKVAKKEANEDAKISAYVSDYYKYGPSGNGFCS